MGKVTKSIPHLSKEEIQERIKSTVGFWRVQKWLVIWNALVDPRPAAEIALHTGLAEQSVHNLISRYNRLGPEVVEGPGKGGRRRSYLSWDEEAGFLESFKQAALTGQITTAAEIKEAARPGPCFIMMCGILGAPIILHLIFPSLLRHHP
jgi:hypothetical protein